jgi:NADH-quinone oxidoreductase subunit L
MVFSVGLAALGIWIAYRFYLQRPNIPEQLAQRFRGAYQLVYNKYYVDEVYDAVFVEGPVLGKSLASSLGRFDLRVIEPGSRGLRPGCQSGGTRGLWMGRSICWQPRCGC